MAKTIAAPVTGVSGSDIEGTVGGVTSIGQAGGADLSFISLFINAEPLVLVIMLGLVAMSVASWAIIIEKFSSLRSVAGQTADFEESFWSSKSIDVFHDRMKKRKQRHPLAIIFTSAMSEWEQNKSAERVVKVPGITSPDRLTVPLKERVVQMMAVSRNRELDRLERGLGFLATCGSAAPFIGLLGTVIGIMNAFRSIASSQNTSLAVVAPGIAEALFATAIGLAVAIPAVVAYNKFNAEINRLAGRFEDFSTEFEAMISRQSESRPSSSSNSF